MPEPIRVLGMAGDAPQAGWDAVGDAPALAGAPRHLAAAPAGPARVPLGAGTPETLRALPDGAVVLASGDPGFFGAVRTLRAAGREVAVEPAPSSVALAFGRVGVPWDDALVVSAHGRDPAPALAAALAHPKVAVLTDPEATPAWFAARLRGTGRRLVVAERLGLPGERVVSGTPEELASVEAAQPNVLLVLDDARAPARARAWALPEAAFDHRAGMVTKREVRALALARLGPGVGDLVWDVGCHSASVAIECARLGAAAYAIDRDPDAAALARANAARHDVPLQVVTGAAPGVLRGLPDPDAVFVGGGGEDLAVVLDACAARARRAVVVTLALVGRAELALERLAAAGLEADATLLQASRLKPLAGGHRLAAENPVFVVSGVRP